MTANKKSYQKSSFGPAFFFLSKRRREALANYYEFCRLMDDIADEPDIPNPQQQLSDWEAEIQRIYQGGALTDLGIRLQKDVQDFAISPDRFMLLIEGMRADLQGRAYSDEEALDWYIYRVAVVVGLATLDILGIKGKEAQSLAQFEGSAVQLTNIIRDVSADAQMGRVYLPEDWLALAGMTRQDVLANRNPRALAAVLQAVAERAEQNYQAAFQQMKRFPRLKMIPCRVMGYVYLKNLAKIRKAAFLCTRPIKLRKIEKINSIVYALFKTFF